MSYLTPIPQEQKLPGWAQETLRRLRELVCTSNAETARYERQVEELETQIADAAKADTGPEDSTAWLWRATDSEVLPPLGLGAGAAVDFTPGGKDGTVEITVEAQGNGIKVTTTGAPMMVIPISRNEFRIQPVNHPIKD